MPRIAEIWIYPVKGLRGRRLETAAVERWGLEGDRRWMVVDRDGRFVSQREAPDMARIEVEPRPGGLVLSSDGGGSVEAATPDASAPRIDVTVWRARVEAALADAAAGDWLAGAIGVEGARLVHMADPERARPVDPEHGAPDDRVTFADEAPLLLATRPSLDDLNARLQRPVPMERFRPNLVLEDCAAWAEDGWSRLRIGAVELSVGWPCTRCVVTTTDQRSGARAQDGEPLTTLATFRPARGGPRFGWNLIPRRLGRIAVGDPVEAE